MVNACLDSVRKQVRRDLSTKERRTLMHDRFLLLQRAHALEPMDQLVVETWIQNLPLLGEAYRTKEAFFAIYDAKTRSTAEHQYQIWTAALSEDVRPFFSPVLTALTNWHQEIFAYFDQPVTNAYTESVNNLIRAIQRQGRGYTFDVLRAKMLYSVGVQKTRVQRYGLEQFTTVTDGSLTHRMMDAVPFSLGPERKIPKRRSLVGSDFTQLIALLQSQDP